MVSYSEMEHLISEYVIGRKSERDREILRLYYLRGYTYEQIAEKMQMSSVQIGRIVRKRGDPLLLMIEK